MGCFILIFRFDLFISHCTDDVSVMNFGAKAMISMHSHCNCDFPRDFCDIYLHIWRRPALKKRVGMTLAFLRFRHFTVESRGRLIWLNTSCKLVVKWLDTGRPMSGFDGWKIKTSMRLVSMLNVWTKKERLSLAPTRNSKAYKV